MGKSKSKVNKPKKKKQEYSKKAKRSKSYKETQAHPFKLVDLSVNPLDILTLDKLVNDIANAQYSKYYDNYEEVYALKTDLLSFWNELKSKYTDEQIISRYTQDDLNHLQEETEKALISYKYMKASLSNIYDVIAGKDYSDSLREKVGEDEETMSKFVPTEDIPF